VSFNAGATSRHENYDRQGVTSTDQGVFKFRHFNFSNQVSIQYSQVRNIVGAYGQAEFDYNKYLYLTVAARNDWVSNTFDNSIAYPSACLFIPSKVFWNNIEEWYKFP
jgi:outer membrane receptor protein involved in Fe transport